MTKLIQFTKMHNAGNDYVYIDLDMNQIDNISEFAIKWSHRRFGVGSDGLILIDKSERADAKMTMYNSDGSYSEMCGNGLLSLSKYIYDHKKVLSDCFTVESGNLIYEIEIAEKVNSYAQKIKMKLPPPIFDGAKIPSIFSEHELINYPFQFNENLQFNGTLISLGNPHIVIFTDNIEKVDLEKIGELIENHDFFPERINVEFAQVMHQKLVKQRTWERGSGETWACGSGAAAVAIASILNNKTEKELTVKLLGGELEFSWESKTSPIYMIGQPQQVFKGTLKI